VYERANGRLYVSADFALPRDLDPDEQGMPTALDTFRAQRAAAAEVYATLRETSELVRGLQGQVNALMQDRRAEVPTAAGRQLASRRRARRRRG
jgi:hypothetical protein